MDNNSKVDDNLNKTEGENDADDVAEEVDDNFSMTMMQKICQDFFDTHPHLLQDYYKKST